MSEDKVSLMCEGDLECPNTVELTGEEAQSNFINNISNLCSVCKPKYGHLSSSKNTELGNKDL